MGGIGEGERIEGPTGGEYPSDGKEGDRKREGKETGGEAPPGIEEGGVDRKERGNPTVGEAPSERKEEKETLPPDVAKAGVT